MLVLLSMPISTIAYADDLLPGLVDDESVEIRGPGGIKREDSPYERITVASSISSDKSSKSKSKLKTKTSKVTQVVSCVLPKIPADIAVDAPTIPKVDLTKVDHTITINKGELLYHFLNRAHPDDFGALTNEQLLAAIFRANPKAFNDFGLLADAKVNIPSIDRIALERFDVGQEIMTRINDRTIGSYKIPDLVLPWKEEETRIAEQLKLKKARDAQVAAIEKEYKDCLAKVEAAKKAERQKIEQAKLDAVTEASLDDESFMIDDSANETYNAQGKRVVRLISQQAPAVTEKAKVANKDSKAAGTVKGATLSFGGKGTTGAFEKTNVPNKDGSNVQGRGTLSDKDAEIKRLKEQLAKVTQENLSLKSESAKKDALFNEELKSIKDNIAALNAKVDSDGAIEFSENAAGKDDNSLLITIISAVGGIVFLILICGFAYLRIRKNKIHQALMDEDDVDVGVDDLNVFGDIHNGAGGAQAVSSGAQATDDDIKIDDTAQKHVDDIDLELPDESIPDVVVESGKPDNPPDLVPPRESARSSADIDEKDFKIDLANITAHESEPVAPTALEEIDIPSPEVAHEVKDNIKTTQESPQPKVVGSDDEDVMNAWADALNESKEGAKEEAKGTEAKVDVTNAQTDAKTSDEDVMSAWADALNESKEGTKEEVKGTEAKVDVTNAQTDAKTSDEDVMSAWADALNESKEAEKNDAKDADKPKEIKIEDISEVKGNVNEVKPAKSSDEDIMNAWAEALSETKDKK